MTLVFFILLFALEHKLYPKAHQYLVDLELRNRGIPTRRKKDYSVMLDIAKANQLYRWRNSWR